MIVRSAEIPPARVRASTDTWLPTGGSTLLPLSRVRWSAAPEPLTSKTLTEPRSNKPTPCSVLRASAVTAGDQTKEHHPSRDTELCDDDDAYHRGRSHSLEQPKTAPSGCWRG